MQTHKWLIYGIAHWLRHSIHRWFFVTIDEMCVFPIESRQRVHPIHKCWKWTMKLTISHFITNFPFIFQLQRKPKSTQTATLDLISRNDSNWNLILSHSKQKCVNGFRFKLHNRSNRHLVFVFIFIIVSFEPNRNMCIQYQEQEKQSKNRDDKYNNNNNKKNGKQTHKTDSTKDELEYYV